MSVCVSVFRRTALQTSKIRQYICQSPTNKQSYLDHGKTRAKSLDIHVIGLVLPCASSNI